MITAAEKEDESSKREIRESPWGFGAEQVLKGQKGCGGWRQPIIVIHSFYNL